MAIHPRIAGVQVEDGELGWALERLVSSSMTCSLVCGIEIKWFAFQLAQALRDNVL